MDTYENDGVFDTQPEQPVTPQPAPPVTPPRKPSPFADSPYVMAGETNRQSYYSGYYQQPTPQSAPQQPSKPASKGVSKGWVVALAICMVLGFAAFGISLLSVQSQMQEQNALLIQSYEEKLGVLRQELEEMTHIGSGDSVSGTPNAGVDGGLTPAQVYAQNAKSVVAINCSNVDSYFGQTMESTSSGSGFVLTEDGYIASNYHVVKGATSIKVITWEGKEYTAKFVGGEESNDIALLKVEAQGLAPVTVGSSDALIVGDQVAAIGNPLGELASTLTVGYVSAKDRIVATDGTRINMLQTDAAINPGNSGGPLFNMKGEVVGITTAKYSGTTDSGASIEGIGFAIPIDDVLGMLDDLKEYGYVTGAYMGVTVSDVPSEDAALYGLPMGVLVHEVTAGSCSQKAGLRPQDIIVGLGGYEIENMNDLTRALRKFKAGDTVTLTVYRHGAGETVLNITLDEKPVQNTEPATEPSENDDYFDNWFDHFFGN